MTSFDRWERRAKVAAYATAAAGLLWLQPTPALGQGFTPKSDEALSETTVRVGPASNTGNEQILRIGIEQCRELTEDDSTVVRFNFNRQIQANQEADAEAAIFEFDVEDGPQEDCSTDVPDDACSSVEESENDVTLTLNNQFFEVQMPFERFQTFDDGASELCTPPNERDGETSSENGGSNEESSSGLDPASSHLDAGVPDVRTDLDSPLPDTGVLPDGSSGADAGADRDAGPTRDTTSRDAGMVSDAGGAADAADGKDVEPSSDATDRFDAFRPRREDATTGAGEESTVRFDRIYVLRAFLNDVSRNVGSTLDPRGRPFRVDGVLWLDRTRPGDVREVSNARASENKLVVGFAPPSNEDDVENYHVFYSNNPIDTSQSPADIADSDAVDQLILTNVDEKNGTTVGEVEIDRTAGSTLYVAMTSRDVADNFSQLTALDQSIEVEESLDFWEKYTEAGGAETGGCGCTNTARPPLGTWMASLLLMALAGVWRRRRLRRTSSNE